MGLGAIRWTFLRNTYSYAFKFQSDVSDRASGTRVAPAACMLVVVSLRRAWLLGPSLPTVSAASRDHNTVWETECGT